MAESYDSSIDSENQQQDDEFSLSKSDRVAIEPPAENSTRIRRHRNCVLFAWVIIATSSILIVFFILYIIPSTLIGVVSRINARVFSRPTAINDCPPGTALFCRVTQRCLSSNVLCDRYQDCPDDSDEANCTCLPQEYSCLRGRCVSVLFLCDKIFDCPLKDDEGLRICGKCNDNEYRCKGRLKVCIPKTKWCDYVQDCEQGDDEELCVHLTEKGELKISLNGRSNLNVCASGWQSEWSNPFCMKAKYLFLTASGFKKMHKQTDYEATRFDVKMIDDELHIFNETEVDKCENNLVIILNCLKEECGKRIIKSEKFESNYIVYGKKTERGEFPWHARLLCDNTLCGGSVIMPRWVVTAGHCVVKADGSRFNPYQCMVSVGAIFKNDKNWIIYQSEKIIPHEKYSKDGNDIALIKLKNSIVFSRYVQPICLPQRPYREMDFPLCISTGLGKTIYDEKSSVLMQQRMAVRKGCEKIVEEFNQTSNICIGTHDGFGYSNICAGDSGGPFACRSVTGDRWTLFGIHSFVIGVPLTKDEKVHEFCQTSFDVNVYTYIKWIHDSIKSND